VCNRFHERRPFRSFSPSDLARIVPLLSSRVCRSSSLRRNSRQVVCSITSSGLEMPPDQKAFQIWQPWL
jgi:hypothetical protein